MRLKSILESLIFASDRPITVKQLKELTSTSKTETVTTPLEDHEAEYRETLNKGSALIRACELAQRGFDGFSRGRSQRTHRAIPPRANGEGDAA